MDPYHWAPRHRRNDPLQALPQMLSVSIALDCDHLDSMSEDSRYPVVFITGVPRFGSTVLLQWLVNCGHFRAPTNWVSRFWHASCFGAWVDRMLFEPEMDS